MNSDLKDRVRAQAGNADAEPDAGEQPEETSSALITADRMYRWLEERVGYFERALPTHMDGHASTFTLTALTHIRRNNALSYCDRDSLLMALIQAAHFGLLPDGKQCAIVPYGKEARFMPMVEGLTDLMYRSGAVTGVRRGLIYEADEWSLEPSAPVPHDFVFKPDRLSADRGAPILAYAFCWMRGGGRSEVITFSQPEAEEHRDKYSKAFQLAEKNRRQEPDGFARNPNKGKYNSTWHTEFPKMWLKTPVRMLAKEVSTSPEMRLLLLADDAADSTLNDGPYRPVIPLDPRDWQEVTDGEQPDAIGQAAPEWASTGAGRDGVGEAGADWPTAAQPGSGGA